MPSSKMCCRVTLVRTDVSEERITVTRIGELGTTLIVTRNRNTLLSVISLQRVPVAIYCLRCSCLADSCPLDDGCDTFLQHVGSYNSHTASLLKRRPSS
jgi:hypothetical protein